MSTSKYLIVKPGIVTEKVVGGGDDPEKLAEDMIAIADTDKGVTYSIRGPQGALVFTYTAKV